jgi:peptidoglycan hydrolase-like protein with peptidoglycan-binding domain
MRHAFFGIIMSVLAIPAFGMDQASTDQYGSSRATFEHLDRAASAIDREVIKRIQRKLNKRGFDAGHVDGKWGPHTVAAIKNFQQRRHLSASGRIDNKTMAALGLPRRHATTGSGAVQN